MTYKMEYDWDRDELHIFSCRYFSDCDLIALPQDIVMGFEDKTLVSLSFFNACESFNLDAEDMSRINQINLRITVNSDIIILNCELVVISTVKRILKSININRKNIYGISGLYEEIVI